MKRLLLALALSVALVPGFAQKRDSVYTASEQFKFTKLIVPGVLVGAGAIVSFVPSLHETVDVGIRDRMNELSGGTSFNLDHYLQYAPALAYGIAAPFASGQHNWKERGLALGTSFAVMMALVYGVKWTTGVVRPNDAGHSFPSGHSAMAFLGAELVRLEYGTWWGVLAYSAAFATGFLRIYNNWHWTSDVLAGAGVGILSAHIGYWLLPWERKLLGIDSGQRQIALLPFATSSPAGSCYGLSLTCNF